jgi:hypothetical protein
VSKHIYKPDINNAVAALTHDEKLKEFYDQYIKLLEEDRTRSVKRKRELERSFLSKDDAS